MAITCGFSGHYERFPASTVTSGFRWLEAWDGEGKDHVRCGCRRRRPIRVTSLGRFLGKQVADATRIHDLWTEAVRMDWRRQTPFPRRHGADADQMRAATCAPAAAALVFGLGRDREGRRDGGTEGGRGRGREGERPPLQLIAYKIRDCVARRRTGRGRVAGFAPYPVNRLRRRTLRLARARSALTRRPGQD